MQNHKQGKFSKRKREAGSVQNKTEEAHSGRKDIKSIEDKDISYKSQEKSPKLADKDSLVQTKRSRAKGKSKALERHLSNRSGPSVEKQKDSSKNSKMSRRDESERSFGEEGRDRVEMHHLFRQLGSGFEVFAPSFMGPSSSRVKTLLVLLKSENEGDRMTALSELCEIISVSSEDSMFSFPVEEVVPLLVNSLNGSPETMLMASRALTLLADIYPPSSEHIARHRGVQILCEKLLCIEYIDLAEQSIQALGKISQSCPEALLEAGALEAMLSFLDFFQIGLQRVAVNTAANVCACIMNVEETSALLPSLKAIVPTLAQLTSSVDNKVSLSALQALTSIVDACQHLDWPLEEVLPLAMLENIIKTILEAIPGVKPCRFYATMHLLSACAYCSSDLSKTLLESSLMKTIAGILRALSSRSHDSSNEYLKPRNSEELLLLVSLCDNMLAPVLDSDVCVLNKSKNKRAMKAIMSNTFSEYIVPSRTANFEEKRRVLQDNDILLDKLATDFVDALLYMETSSFSQEIKARYLSVIDKFVFYASVSCLSLLAAELPVSNFLIGLLQEVGELWPFASLKLMASMLQKDPELKNRFIREGVIQEIHKSKEVMKSSENVDKHLADAFLWSADKILSSYFGDEKSRLSDQKTEGMKILEKLTKKFPTDEAVQEFVSLVLSRSISSYEIQQTNILESLRGYLACDDISAPKEKHWVDRLISFYSMLSKDGSINESISKMISMLQEVLMHCEKFPCYRSVLQSVPSFPSILLSNLGLSGTPNDADSDSLDPFYTSVQALGTPIKIKLQCLNKDYQIDVGVVLIEPLATVGQVQEYIRPKIQKLLSQKYTDRAAGEPSCQNRRMTRARAKQLGYKPGMGMDLGSRGKAPDTQQNDKEEEEEDEDDDEIFDDLAGGDFYMMEETSKEESCEDDEPALEITKSRNNARLSTSQAWMNDKAKIHVALKMNGNVLNVSDTLLRVLQSDDVIGAQPNSDLSIDMEKIWRQVHQLDFSISNVTDDLSSRKNIEQDAGKDRRISTKPAGCPWTIDKTVADISGMDHNMLPSISILRAFDEIRKMCASMHHRDRFVGLATESLKSLLVNSKISSKLAKQIRDPLLICSRTLPQWCYMLPYKTKFLFPFDLRQKFFRYNAFGLNRTMLAILEDTLWQGNNGTQDQSLSDDLPFRMPKIPRQKVRISRSHVMNSARKVFDRFANRNSRLEVEFYNEVGSGLGPTLEFYTLLSYEFQVRSLNMWRDPERLPDSMEQNNDNLPGPLDGEFHGHKGGHKDLVKSPLGLFPRPLQYDTSNEKSDKVMENFSLLGQVIAKALQDNRLLDIPLSPAFYKFAVHGSLDFQDLWGIAPELADFLEEIQSSMLHGGSRICVHGAPIDDLSLYFVLPGDEAFELCPGGGDLLVTSDNAPEYVEKILNATIGTGVRQQMEAFRAGFDKIFSISQLEIFNEEEIAIMACGAPKQTWNPASLLSSIKCDHGYSSDSPQILSLVNVLSELDGLDQRRFLKFVTGAPRLPFGGFASLHPRLTVVRKMPTLDESSPKSPKSREERIQELADKDLPSVMTCANYVKLPPYSSEKILKERLLFAIREGQGSFDLS